MMTSAQSAVFFLALLACIAIVGFIAHRLNKYGIPGSLFLVSAWLQAMGEAEMQRRERYTALKVEAVGAAFPPAPAEEMASTESFAVMQRRWDTGTANSKIKADAMYDGAYNRAVRGVEAWQR